ncbi:YihY/virulence factor BrkB family protein [Leptolyngbya sp. FACHB-261]|uniref:YihY/virulence factor BrkB family protein n=1 Tax=Leptolyngbya sp. FACHB-261 TaxID=2692806 RepID=UPI001689226F|nr:YihY/virulence factor BrkB family protein [Leptolyngbya sp. FACHB-261]
MLVQQWVRNLYRLFKTCARVCRYTVQQSIENNLGSAAAEMAYYAMLSLLPSALILVVVIGLFASSEQTFNWMMATLAQAAPRPILELVGDNVRSLAASQKGQVFSFSLLATLWAASAFFAPLIRVLNCSYQVPPQAQRPWWLNRILAIGLFAGTVLMVLLASLLLFLGRWGLRWGAERLGVSSFLVGLWGALIWPLSLGLVALAFAFIYRFAPAQQPVRAPVWPGALAGSLIWLIVSLGFRLYVASFGQFNRTYGSIGAVIVLLIWLFLSAFGLLLGGELNVAIARVRQLQATTPPRPSRLKRLRRRLVHWSRSKGS